MLGTILGEASMLYKQFPLKRPYAIKLYSHSLYIEKQLLMESSNVKRGLIRLWVAISVPWICFCSYQLYQHNRAWKYNFEIAKSQSSELDSERALMIQNYVLEHKAFVEKLRKDGVQIGTSDDVSIRDQGYSKALQEQEKGEKKRLRDQSFRDAFDARDARDSYLYLLPSVPLGSALIFVLALWVIRGFKIQR